jgi:reductive dehalogenase
MPKGKGTNIAEVPDGDAEKVYAGEKLKRFSEKNMAFKKVSEDLGRPWFEVWMKNMLGQYENARIGSRIPVADIKEARAHISLWVGASTWNRLTMPYGEGHENKGFLSWKPINVPLPFRGNPEPDPDPEDLAQKVKQIARFLGANRVGIAKLNRKWIYAETCRNIYSADEPRNKKIIFRNVKEPDETETELIIPETVRFAVVTILDLNRTLTRIGSSSIDTSVATNIGYSRMGITDVALAEAIRTLGYTAIPCKNGTGLSIPMAIDAGLGQLGRNGLLITPDFGAGIRIGKVLTDMPLIPDQPIDFGVTEFCESCMRCAKTCEVEAISFGDKSFEPPVETGNPGALKWYVNGKACLNYWIESGASCTACQAVCPFTQGRYEVLDPSVVWEMEVAPFGIGG